MSKIILTGDRPTGKLHVGHYVGSLKRRVELQNSGEYDKIFIMIADAQALTDNADNPEKVRQNIIEVALDYLSVGLDPAKSDIFIQSQISQLTELTFYYMNLVTVSRLQRNPTVKSEIQMRNFEASIPVGFFCYPISHVCDGKKLATLFYEPSTRTRLSFEAAMLNLGGSVLGFSSANSSSASKGESVADTIRVISCYADICAMRHPKEGAPMVAASKSSIPVINAGDGGHQHPTQTLTDLMTIRELRGSLDNFTIGLCGDLKFGRTVHSLINSLVRYKNVKFVLISPKELRIPDYIRDDVLKANNAEFVEMENLEDAMPELNILYMTRVQRERFFSEDEYLRMKDFYILDKSKMALAKEDMYVLHPLPRVNEISVDIDDDPRAAYFKQVQFGVYVRMALIMTLLGLNNK
jgi:aspartate carbamoyltransferase catalytic subunit